MTKKHPAAVARTTVGAATALAFVGMIVGFQTVEAAGQAASPEPVTPVAPLPKQAATTPETPAAEPAPAAPAAPAPAAPAPAAPAPAAPAPSVPAPAPAPVQPVNGTSGSS